MPKLPKKAKSRHTLHDDILHGQAACLLIRSELLSQVTHAIEAEGLTRRQAAKVLDVTQARIGDLFRGRSDLFSIDALVEMLGRLGVSVTLKTRRRPMQEIKSKRGFLRGIDMKVPREDDRT